MATDFSKLSDEELFALAGQKPQTSQGLSSLSDEELFAMAGTQPQVSPEQSTFGEFIRPVARAAKSLAVGTVGSAADLAQQAVNLPGFLVNQAAQAITGDESVSPVPQFGGVNTASRGLATGIDELTGGLTVPRGRGEELLEVGQEIAGGIVGPGAIRTAATAASDVASLVGKRALQFGTGVTKKSEELVKAFTDAGVKPTLANISEAGTTKTFQNLLANFPGSRGVIEKATQGQIDDITKQLAGITKSPGGTVQQTGKVIQEGAIVQEAATQNRISKLYDDLDKFIPEGVSTPTTNLQRIAQDPAIQDVAAVGAGDTAKVLQRFQGITDDAGNISYPRLKVFRSTVGAKLQSPSLGGDERSAIKKIYSALSEDMKSAVTAQGGEKGLQAFNKANNNFIRASERLDKQINPLIKADTPEKVFNLALSGTKQGGSNIKPIMKGLDQTQKEFVRGTVAKRMGTATPGQQDAAGEVFSPNKFLTEWNKLSPEARSNIFTKGQANSINTLNKVISSIKESGKVAQTSNNLPYLTYLGLGGILATSPAAAGGVVGGAAITSRMITNPTFVKWLAKAPKVRGLEIPKHLKALSVISAGGNAELKEDTLNYLDSITTQQEQ